MNEFTKEELEEIQFILQQWNEAVSTVDLELLDKVMTMIDEMNCAGGCKP